MDLDNRFQQIKILPTDLLRGQDRKTQVMNRILNVLVDHTRLIKSMPDLY